MNRINSVALLLLTFLMTSFAYIHQEVELEVQAVLDGRMEMLLPKNFKAFSEDEVQEGATANVVFENEAQTISLALNYATAQVKQENIPDFQESFAGSVKAGYNVLEWKKDEIIEVDGHKIGLMEFVAKDKEVESYFMMFYTDVAGRLLISTFNSPRENMEEWAPLANKMVNSIKML